MRDFAHPFVSAIFSFFWGGVLPIAYSQDARTDFDVKNVTRRGPAQGRAFWGHRTHNLTFTPLLSPKTVIFGPHFDGTIFSSENGLNIGQLESPDPDP